MADTAAPTTASTEPLTITPVETPMRLCEKDMLCIIGTADIF